MNCMQTHCANNQAIKNPTNRPVIVYCLGRRVERGIGITLREGRRAQWLLIEYNGEGGGVT